MTCWQGLAAQAQDCLPGQLLVLTGLRTKANKGVLYVNCAQRYRGNLLVVSTCPGILLTPNIPMWRRFLVNMSDGPPCGVCLVTTSALSELSGPLFFRTHVNCGGVVEAEQPCGKCKNPGPHTRLDCSVVADLDDGTDSVSVTFTTTALCMALEVPIASTQWAALTSHRHLQRNLKSILHCYTNCSTIRGWSG